MKLKVQKMLASYGKHLEGRGLMTTIEPTVGAGLDRMLGPIAADLQAVEQILSSSLSGGRASVAELTEYLSHYRGKRLRPMVLLLVASACGGVSPEHHILAAVVEMIHTATLVHDDVLDRASVRRHVTTVNARWGNQRSVLLGDLLFTRAFHLASTVDAEACRIIGEATNRVCEGEICQSSQSGNLALGEADYLEMIEGKTATLTECCCLLGAKYARAADPIVADLANYGRCLGMAFQIADDILDLVGTEVATGKSLGTDVNQSKMTLPLIRLLAERPVEDRVRIEAILNGQANHKLERIQPFLRESDALPYSRRRAQSFVAEAMHSLGRLPASAAKGILIEILNRVIDRDS